MNKNRYLPAVILTFCLLVLWQAAAAAVNIPHIFPSPTAILKRTWELCVTLITYQLPTTMLSIVTGWGLAIIIGVALAILMDLSPKVEAMLHGALIVTQTIPVMCISPLFVLWFGYTLGARLLAVVLSTFFAITLNTYDGLHNIDREKEELLKTYGAGWFQIFTSLKLPSALPMFVTSLKMTFPWAVIDAAVAEWLGGTTGLGYFSKRMVTKMDGPAVFAAILVLCLISLIGMKIISMIDKKYLAYRNEM